MLGTYMQSGGPWRGAMDHAGIGFRLTNIMEDIPIYYWLRMLQIFILYI